MRPSVWMASMDGLAPREIPYERIFALLTSTPRNQWRRRADGSLVVGAWTFKRQS
jgi:hypothetical protein